MKIVMICEFFGAELGFQENALLKAYRELGHEVTVLTSLHDSVFDYYDPRIYVRGSPKVETHLGATVHKLPYRYNVLNKLRPLKGVLPIIEAAAPDLVYVHGVTPNLPELARYVRAHRECAMIMDSHFDRSNSGRNALSLKVLHGTIRRWFLDRARPHIARFLPITPASFDFLEKIYGVPREQMDLLPLGADMTLVDELRTSDTRADVRAQHGIPDDAFVVFTGGKLVPRKRVELLIAAIAGSPRLDGVHILIAGRFSPDATEYEAAVRTAARPISQRVHFAGWLKTPEVYAHMLASDAAVFPASQSVMWQQAIGAGLPLLVGTLLPGSASYLNLHDNMRILEPDEITTENVQRFLEEIVADPDLRARMAAGADRTAREYLDWHRIAEQTLGYVRQPAGGCPGRC